MQHKSQVEDKICSKLFLKHLRKKNFHSNQHEGLGTVRVWERKEQVMKYEGERNWRRKFNPFGNPLTLLHKACVGGFFDPVLCIKKALFSPLLCCAVLVSWPIKPFIQYANEAHTFTQNVNRWLQKGVKKLFKEFFKNLLEICLVSL